MSFQIYQESSQGHLLQGKTPKKQKNPDFFRDTRENGGDGGEVPGNLLRGNLRGKGEPPGKWP